MVRSVVVLQCENPTNLNPLEINRSHPDFFLG
jgi:hypothetical protein